MGFLNDAADLGRIYLSSTMLDAPETFGPNAQRNRELNAAARERLGIAGDAAYAAGFLTPGLGAFKALKMLPAAVRGLSGGLRAGARATASATRTAGSAARNVIHPGVTRAEALGRLGVAHTPSAASRAVGSVARHPIKSAGYAAGFGGVTYAAGNNRNYDAAHPVMQAAVAQPASRMASPRAAERQGNGLFAERLMAGVDAYEPAPFQQALSGLAARQGGKVSIEQAQALAEIMQRTTPKAARAPTPQQTAFEQAMAYTDAERQANIEAGMSAADANRKWQQDRLQLLKVQPNWDLMAGDVDE